MKGGFFIRQVIYVDVLLLLNLLVNYLLLLSAGAILHTKMKRIQAMLSSLLGSIYSLIIFIPNIHILMSLISKIVVSILMVLFVFKNNTIKQFLRNYAAFFLVNFLFAGFMFAVWIVFKPNGMIYQNGAVYFDINAEVLTVSAVICYLASLLISHFLKRRAPDSHIIDLEIIYQNKSIFLKALLDTGNTLKEPFSYFPVIVCENKSISKILSEEIKSIINNPTKISYSNNSNIRFVSFKSVGGSGLLPAFKPTLIKAYKDNVTFNLSNVYIAVYKNTLSNGEYNALMGSSFFENATKGEKTY